MLSKLVIRRKEQRLSVYRRVYYAKDDIHEREVCRLSNAFLSKYKVRVMFTSLRLAKVISWGIVLVDKEEENSYIWLARTTGDGMKDV